MRNEETVVTSIQNQLNTKFVGQQLYHYSHVTSTMEMAKKAAIEGAPEGTVIIADEQTSGRGRLNRTWLSPRGNLAVSIILRPSLNDLPKLIMVTSLAVVQSIKRVTGLETQIKWPNDVLIKGKKVCGILIESEIKGQKVNFVILGIGINVELDTSAFPDISAIATSLSRELGAKVSKAELTSVLLSELEQLYLEAKTGAPVHREWQKRMETLGKWIQVNNGETTEYGKAENVAENGNLILRRADDKLVEIVVGDVTIMND